MRDGWLVGELLTIKRLNLRESGAPAEMLPVYLGKIGDKKGVICVGVAAGGCVQYAVPEMDIGVSMEEGRQLREDVVGAGQVMVKLLQGRRRSGLGRDKVKRVAVG